MGHAVSVMVVLAWAASVFLWTGDLESAQLHIDWSISQAESHSVAPFVAVGQGHKGVLAIVRGDADSGVEHLQNWLEKIHATRYELLTTEFNIALAQGLAALDRFSEGMTLIDETIRLADANGDTTYVPELLRVRGELLRLDDALGEEAEGCFRQALQLSKTQDALSWELRAATSLATLYRAQDRSGDAIACLQPVYERFKEGFDTADLILARRLLDALSVAARDRATHDSVQ